MPDETVAAQAVDVAYSLLVMAGTTVVSVLLYVVVVRLLFRLGRTDRFAVEAIARCRWPGRLTVALVALLASLPLTELEMRTTDRLSRVLSLLAIASGAWLLLRLAGAIEATLLGGVTWEEEDPDSAQLRSRTTKIILLRRIGSGLVVMVAIGGALLTFPTVRTLGTSLLASAGILGLVVGIAAQPTLGNLVAGIQLAVAEPMNIDDAVVVEGEWGNVEEITLTYVVVRLWDRRRLVLPTSYFVNTPFHNWSLRGTQVIGSVVWKLDLRTPVEAVRREFHRQVDAHPLWDGDVAVLQVIDADERSMSLRGLVTAATAGKVWDLRCAIREGVLTWLAVTHPEALPATRLLEAPATPERMSLHDDASEDQTVVISPGPDTEPNPDPGRTGEWPVPRHP